MLRGMNGLLAAPFRFSAADARELEDAGDLFFDPQHSSVPASWTGSASARMAFGVGRLGGLLYVVVTLGRCTLPHPESDDGDQDRRVRRCIA